MYLTVQVHYQAVCGANDKRYLIQGLLGCGAKRAAVAKEAASGTAFSIQRLISELEPLEMSARSSRDQNLASSSKCLLTPAPCKYISTCR